LLHFLQDLQFKFELLTFPR